MELALAILDGPVVSALLGASGLKLPFRSIALALAVSSLPRVQPYDAVRSLRKASWNRPGMQATCSQLSIISKQLLNVRLFITNIQLYYL